MEKEMLEKIVKESKTINEVLTKMGKNTSSAGYKLFKRKVLKYEIDVSHFLTPSESIKKQFVSGKLFKTPIDNMFIENSLLSRGTIKRRIISDKLIKYECVFCENKGEWMGKKISLILDHKNGVNNDHRLENLRFLCPNCNSTLDTHCIGHKCNDIKERKEKIREYKPREETRKVNRPDIETLTKQIKVMGYVQTAKRYGVSDNTIRKWVKWIDNKSIKRSEPLFKMKGSSRKIIGSS